MPREVKWSIVTLVILLALSCMAIAGEPVKAYRNLVFGESRRETDRKIVADKALQGNSYTCFATLAGNRYGLECGFDQDRLFLIKFTANFTFTDRIYSASQFDKTLMEVETLRSIIETQYGPPHGVEDVSLLSAKDGKVAFRYYWEIDSVKAIMIGIAARQFKYWVEMSICHIPIMAEISARLAQQESTAVMDSAGDF